MGRRCQGGQENASRGQINPATRTPRNHLGHNTRLGSEGGKELNEGAAAGWYHVQNERVVTGDQDAMGGHRGSTCRRAILAMILPVPCLTCELESGGGGHPPATLPFELTFRLTDKWRHTPATGCPHECGPQETRAPLVLTGVSETRDVGPCCPLKAQEICVTLFKVGQVPGSRAPWMSPL